MSPALKVVAQELVEAIFAVVSGPGTESDKVAKLERATAAIVSETAAEAAIDAGLKVL
jgi:hypothetical protein